MSKGIVGKRSLLVIITIALSISGYAQTELFSIEGKDVSSDEFKYVYNKNSHNNPDAFSDKDMKEYFELFLNFKLKVQEALNQGLGRDSTLINEFESYKKQLKKPYLTDERLSKKLVDEAYNRLAEEINASHILIKIASDASPKDTLAAYNKIISIREQAKTIDFAQLAYMYSEDGGGGKNDGNLGYFTSMQMVYPFESVAYNTPVGEVSQPVRSKFGYHLIKVNDRRPSQGKVQVAHIMIRFSQNMTAQDSLAKEKIIFDIADQLNTGYNWDELCKLYSDDLSSKDKGGILRPFRTGNLPPSFSEKAYELETPGDISDPLVTPFGWHIIKLVKKIGVESFEEIEPTLKARINSDTRSGIKKKALIQKLIEENNVVIEQDIIDKLLDPAIANENLANQKLLSIESEVIYASEYLQHDKAKQNQVHEFVNEKIIAFEEENLESKYPEFKHLLAEYWEGILLFQIMDQEVWKKASIDTLGLSKFFTKNTERYIWHERISGKLIVSQKKEVIDSIYSILKSSPQDSIEELYSSDNFSATANFRVENGPFERESSVLPKNLEWKVGIQKGEENSIFYILHADQIIPAGPKKLNETKGIVISDYQDELEKLWIKHLKNKYKVKINKKAVKNVYKSLKK